jgi:cytochrome b6-f complex iron-sulfur subunit
MNRRSFLDWLIRVSGVVLGGFVLYPVARYLVPPKIPEAATRRVIAAKKDELKPGSFKTFPFGGQPAILIRRRDGVYRAFTAVCTHLGCTVQYRDKDQLIWCACHDGIYDLNGRNVSGPPPRPLEMYDVHEIGDQIVVERGQGA